MKVVLIDKGVDIDSNNKTNAFGIILNSLKFTVDKVEKNRPTKIRIHKASSNQEDKQ